MLSVILCTHNPDRAVLARVLDALRRQTLPPAAWEFILVDNHSDPPPAAGVELRAHAAARRVHEPRLGLTAARLGGLAAGRGDLLVFVDDDNLLAEDYLAQAADIMDRHPFLGTLGGVGSGEFGAPLEPWLREFVTILGVHAGVPDKQLELQYACSRQPGPCVPIGAGLVVRRALAEAYREQLERDPVRRALDRTGGGSLLGAGDTDLVYTGINLGWACGLSNRLRFTHVIPAWRMEKRYVLRLLYASNYGVGRLLLLHGWRQVQPDPAPAWRRGLRALRARLLPPTLEQACWLAQAQGYQDALAGRAFDPRYA